MREGEVFAGRYRVERELGRGGMGVVYEAVDLNLGRQVALKVMSLLLREDPTAAARFRREATALAAVHHPGVVTIYDSGEVDGELFLVMRLVHGSDLGARLSGHRRLSIERTVELVGGIAQALDALHEAGVVHRDVKPSNVLLEGDGERPVLCDFGLAKPTGLAGGVTRSGHLLGTVAYMSPEQLSGEPATAASDVYALGCLLFHCLTGQPPYTGADDVEVIVGHRQSAVPDARRLRQDLPQGVQSVLERCLAKRPAERFARAGEVAEELRRQVQAQPPTVVLPSPAPAPRDPVPKPPPRLAVPRGLLAGCAAVVVGAGLVGGLLGMRSVPDREAIAGGTQAPAGSLDEAEQRLLGVLNEGYGDCTPLERTPGQLAKLNCDRTPDGIATLHIAQWQDAETMAAAYREKYVRRYKALPCKDFAGGSAARGTGHASSRSGVGGVACFVNANTDAVLLWQVDDRALELLAIRDDADSSALFRWWGQHRDQVLRPR